MMCAASGETIYTKQQLILLEAKADSCIVANDRAKAFKYYKEIVDHSVAPSRRIMTNTASLASRFGETDYAMALLWRIVSSSRNWYLTEPLDEDYNALKSHPGWPILNDTITARRNRIEKNYDHGLISRLKKIHSLDQDVRHKYFQAHKAVPADSELIRQLQSEMRLNDSINLVEVMDILHTYGWPKKDVVGGNASALWLVIQHADPATQKKVFPMLKEAVRMKQLKASSLAMLEDRILVAEGKKQIYGSQFDTDPVSGKWILCPIEDETNVDMRRAEVGLEPLADYYLKSTGEELRKDEPN
ncbi:MAG: hypothetical protein K2K77_07850 [Duncaniella sp.]|nr:hypothetical protein [Duncaniella sp.]